MMRWWTFLWVATLGMGILWVMYGCAADPNQESMEECHGYSWHGHPVTVCND